MRGLRQGTIRVAILGATLVAGLMALAPLALAAQGSSLQHAPAQDALAQGAPAQQPPAQQIAARLDGDVPGSGPVDYIFVEKDARRLSLWRQGWLVKTYAIRLGRTPTGDKVREGDGRTPEGLYSIAYRNPQSRFHLSLMTSYPNGRDRARAARLGVPPGGAIAIHGLPNDEDKARMLRIHQYVDWTDGCIAVTDHEIEEIFAMVDPGTPIEIVP